METKDLIVIGGGINWCRYRGGRRRAGTLSVLMLEAQD